MYITLNSQNIYYQKFGKGKDLVMLHGWKQDVSTFHNVAEELKKHFTLWLIDLPGFGRSENPKQAFTVKDYADIVAGFIKENKINKPNLLGHSHGGRTGIKLAANYPEIIEKLILEDAAGIRPKKDTTFYVLFLISKLFRFLIPNIGHLKDRLRRWFYKELESDYLSADELKKTLVNVIKEDLTADIKKIKNETLLVWGENDKNVESDLKAARIMYKLIPKSKLAIIENSGHFPHLDNPQKFLYYVVDFLT